MFTRENPPRKRDCLKALANIELSETEVTTLEFQFSQPGRTITTQDLSLHLFGQRRVAPSNGVYGRLAGKIAKAVGFNTGVYPRRRNWPAISLGDGSGDHFRWIMREEFASALVESGIVDADADGSTIVPPDIDAPDGYFAQEGGAKYRLHLWLERRNRTLAKRKKQQAKSLACEVCTFDSSDVYGDQFDYCEVQHLKPVSQLKSTTKVTLDDLAIVCANCHRVIHTRRPEPYTLKEVRAMIQNAAR